jgi:chemotaxis protein methyltransferase CheR
MIDDPDGGDLELDLETLLTLLFERFHYDFRHYARASLRRRVRLAATQLGCDGVPALIARLATEGAPFLTQLLGYLTVQVSDLFRDPEYFRVFRQRICPILSTYPSLRLWVAGCATGEEVYSLAIVLAEEKLLDRTLLYATDINAAALATAEAGVYAAERVPTFTENHRKTGATCSFSDYYTASYGRALLDRSLRKRIVFSDHSLATDQVFAEVQLVSCRNVLIYFDRVLQDRAITLFGDALARRGFLGLGPRESLRFSKNRELFDEIAQGQSWHQKR